MQNQERDRQKVRERVKRMWHGWCSCLPPHLAPFPALSIIAPHYPGERENAFHALHSMQTSKLIYVARLTMSEMKSQKKKKNNKKERRTRKISAQSGEQTSV